MNKYKIVSLFLCFALLVVMIRLVVVKHRADAAAATTVDARDAVIHNIHTRKSVRSFTDEAVSEEQIDTLLRAAMAAPTGRDMRPWRFVVVDDRALKDSLSAALPYAKMIASAPVTIVVCADTAVTDDKGNKSGNWPLDCSAASENILLAAEAMGLGAVWTGVYPYADRMTIVRTLLRLPAHIVPINAIPVGHPKGNPQPKEKYDAGNIHRNVWSEDTSELQP